MNSSASGRFVFELKNYIRFRILEWIIFFISITIVCSIASRDEGGYGVYESMVQKFSVPVFAAIYFYLFFAYPLFSFVAFLLTFLICMKFLDGKIGIAGWMFVNVIFVGGYGLFSIISFYRYIDSVAFISLLIVIAINSVISYHFVRRVAENDPHARTPVDRSGS